MIDWLLAAALTVGALADASSQLPRGLDVLTIGALLVLTGSVAWRRRHPAVTTSAAVTAFMAFQLASGYSGGGAFEVAAIALNFYLLGRHSPGRARARVSGAVLAYWLAGVVVITYDQPGASVGRRPGRVGAARRPAVCAGSRRRESQRADPRARGAKGAVG